MKKPLINLYVTKHFRVKGDKRLVELYKQRMAVERAFKASKLELSIEKPKWRGIAKIRMHVAITAHKIGKTRPSQQHSSIHILKPGKTLQTQKQA